LKKFANPFFFFVHFIPWQFKVGRNVIIGQKFSIFKSNDQGFIPTAYSHGLKAQTQFVNFAFPSVIQKVNMGKLTKTKSHYPNLFIWPKIKSWMKKLSNFGKSQHSYFFPILLPFLPK
jgi:hypothetical protein